MKKPPKGRLKRCSISGLVIFQTELDAKIVLAERINKDKGEKRYFQCRNHFHLTAEDPREEDTPDGIKAA